MIYKSKVFNIGFKEFIFLHLKNHFPTHNQLLTLEFPFSCGMMIIEPK